MTLTPIAERLSVELSLSVFTTWVCRGWYSNTQPSVYNQSYNLIETKKLSCTLYMCPNILITH